MDSGKVEVEAVEFSEAEKEALDDIQGVFDDLEDGLIMSLNAVRELRKRFKRSETEEIAARAEAPPKALEDRGEQGSEHGEGSMKWVKSFTLTRRRTRAFSGIARRKGSE